MSTTTCHRPDGPACADTIRVQYAVSPVIRRNSTLHVGIVLARRSLGPPGVRPGLRPGAPPPPSLHHPLGLGGGLTHLLPLLLLWLLLFIALFLLFLLEWEYKLNLCFYRPRRILIQ